MEKAIEKFRGEIISIILPTINICFSAGLLFLIAIFFKENFDFDLKMIEAVLILEAVIIPFIGILMLAVTFDYKTTVFNNGISSYNPFGNRKCDFMHWSKMKSVQIKSVLGYKYYFIQSEDLKERLWIPLRIKNKDNFKDIVQSHAGSTNVFAAELTKSET